MCSCRTNVPDRLSHDSGFCSQGSAASPARAGRQARGARAGAGEQALLGSCTGAAERAGVRPGMRLSEALATCPSLELVEQDPAGVEEEWEAVLRRLEGAGFAVEPVEPGCVYFRTRGMERLAGGIGQTLRRALDAVGPEWGRVWAQPPVASRRSPRPPWRRPVARSSSTTARHTSFSSRSPSTSFRSRRSGGRSFRARRQAPGELARLPGPRSPIGSVRTARKHGGSLGGGRPPSRRAVRRPSWLRR